jgi:3-deoxy-manno-octulosonate cytidylyltransferase (CMP-KDO synthetase)
MKAIGVIPVRLESTRLPMKALVNICGMPLILHTLKRTQMAKILDDVYVATDSKEVIDLVEKNGGKAMMTSKTHPTGTDRVAEAAKKIDADIIVNIQGDEALVSPEHIDAGVKGLINSDAEVSILLTKFYKKNVTSSIKAVVNLKNEIMYMSRVDIPSDARTKVRELLKAYHVVSFRKPFLLKYSKMKTSPLEKIEYNEYLKILEHGYKIQGVLVDSDSISVDTPEDLDFVRKKMLKDPLYPIYKI